MARRLAPEALSNPATQVHPGVDTCRVCDGAIVAETVPGRPPWVPQRKVCRRCGAEYGTTRPAEVHY